MKRIGLAISVFMVWFAIAGTYYVCVVKGLCNSETENSFKKEIVETPKTTIENDNIDIIINEKAINKTSTDSIVVDKLGEIPLISEDTDTLQIVNDNITSTEEVKENIQKDSLKSSYLVLNYGNQKLHQFRSNFRIYKNSPLVKISYPIIPYGAILKKQLKKSPESKLKIIGFYDKLEKIELGSQRVDFVKKALIDAGILEEKILTEIVNTTINFNERNYLLGGVDFKFENTDEKLALSYTQLSDILKEFEKPSEAEVINYNLPAIENQKIEEVKIGQSKSKISEEKPVADVIEKPSTIEENKAVKSKAKSTIQPIVFIVSGESFKEGKLKSFKRLKSFIENKYKGQNIYLTGYSNESTSSFDNYTKGLKMANSVKTYLKKRGVISTKVTVIALKEATNKGVTLKMK